MEKVAASFATLMFLEGPLCGELYKESEEVHKKFLIEEVTVICSSSSGSRGKSKLTLDYEHVTKIYNIYKKKFKMI